MHPPLKGEGRTAEGSPGWGGGVAAGTPMPILLHGRHPHPARWRGPTSPLQGEVKDAPRYRTFAASSSTAAAVSFGASCGTSWPMTGMSRCW